MTLALILLILAFVFFVLAAMPKVAQPWPFVPTGLALWALSIIVGAVWPRVV